jgi:hypothetical protein
MNNFQIAMAFKNKKHDVWNQVVAFTSKVMKNSQLMDYLHLIDFISWGVLDNGPLYCITLWNVTPF